MNWKKKYYLDIGIAILIAVLPFCLYLYLLVDENLSSFSFFGKVFIPAEVNGIHSIHLQCYYFLTGFVPFALITLWFLTEKRTLSYFAFFPLFPYLRFCIFSIINLFGIITINAHIITIPFILLLIWGLIKIKRNAGNLLFDDQNFYDLNERENYFIRLFRKRRNLFKYTKIFEKFEKNKSDDLERIKEIYALKLNLAKQKVESKAKSRKDYIFYIILSISPFLIYIYIFIPENTHIKWFYMELNNNGFMDFKSFFYTLMSKITPIMLWVVWYISSRNWWRIVIFVPITIYSYQLYIVAFSSSMQFDENEYVDALPLISIILLFTLILSKIYRYDLKSYSIRKQLDQEIDRLINKFAKGNS